MRVATYTIAAALGLAGAADRPIHIISRSSGLDRAVEASWGSAETRGKSEDLLVTTSVRASPLGAVSDTSILRVIPPAGPSVVYAHSDALFGAVPHGASVVAPLWYPNASNPAVNSSTGCAAASLAGAPKGAVIVLDRGGCTFTTKVLNAQQQASAAGVVVVDNLFQCFADPLTVCNAFACRGCPYTQYSPTCGCGLGYMGDDGSGSFVNIPSMMVGRSDGAAIKAQLETGALLIASMMWDQPTSAGAVEMQLWGHAEDGPTANFRGGLEPYLPYLLGGQAPATPGAPAPTPGPPKLAFQPHAFIWDGARMGCGVVFDCGSQCVNGQLYCSIDPDGDLNKGISGGDVVNENLRQLCLWQHLQAKAFPSPSPTAAPTAAPALPPSVASATLSWWAYADLFLANCNTPALFATQACAQAQMATISAVAVAQMLQQPVPAGSGIAPAFLASGISLMTIDASVVQSCWAHSNDTINATAGTYVNSVLQGELNLQEQMAVLQLPTVLVNDLLLRGSISGANTLVAVCNGYAALEPPPVCDCLGSPLEDLAACVAASGGGGNSGSGGGSDAPSGMPGWAVALVLVFVVGVLATIGAVVWLQRRSRAQMQGMLDEYRAMTDLGDDEQAELAGDGTGVAVRGKRAVGAIATRLQQLSRAVTTVPPPSGGGDESFSESNGSLN